MMEDELTSGRSPSARTVLAKAMYGIEDTKPHPLSPLKTWDELEPYHRDGLLARADAVTRALSLAGFAIVNVDGIGWPEIKAFQDALSRGQGTHEDAGGFMARCIRRLLGIQSADEVKIETYREAARRMIEEHRATEGSRSPSGERTTP